MSAPERQLAAAIEQLFATLMRERGRLADFDPNPLTPTQRVALAILAAHTTGASVRVIAGAAGISYARVFQIIREER